MSNNNGVLEVVNEKGNTPSKSTERAVLREYADKYDFTQGEEYKPEEGEEIYNTDEETANHSNNPSQLAEIALRTKTESFIEENSNTDAIQIIEYVNGNVKRGKIGTKGQDGSFIGMSDVNNISYSIAKTYLRSDGRGLDVLAKELTKMMGKVVTEQDIINTMLKYPNGVNDVKKDVRDMYSSPAKNRFTELTGFPANDYYLEKAVEQAIIKEDLRLEMENNYLLTLTDDQLLELDNNIQEYEKAINQGAESITTPKHIEGRQETSRVQEDATQENGGSQEPNQEIDEDYLPFSINGSFTEITKKQFKKLISKLSKAFPSIKGKIILGESEMANRLKELSNKSGGIQFLKTEQGEVYGFVDPENGNIYLDDNKMNANTPFHEIAGHTFLNILKESNRPVYDEIIKKLSQQSEMMNEVRNDPAYAHLKTDEQIADELFARLIGNKGEAMFNSMADKSLVEKIKDVINRLWEDLKQTIGVGNDFSNIRDWSVEDFKNATLGEILNNVTQDALSGKRVTPNVDNAKKTVQDQQTELGVQYSMLNDSDFNADGTIKDSVLSEIAEERAKIERETRANGTWMKAPNGKDTNLNEDQWVTVRTKRFKDWFGDWQNDPQNASKVVDENGEPMVVYHGTNAEFNEFEVRVGIRGNQYTGAREVKSEVFFFTSDKQFAQKASYARKENFGGKSNVKEVFLNIRRPLDFSEYTAETEEVFKEFVGEYPHQYFGYIENLDQWWTLFDNDSDDITNKVKEKGYEGVILAETTKELKIDVGHTETVVDTASFGVFSPNQIKSATDNVGTYSNESNDIRYQIIPFKTNNQNKHLYNKALDMFHDGKSLEDIWQETGFFLRQNTNNNQWEWAYRIDQNKMEVNLPTLKSGDKLKLSDVINYPEFFTTFPNSKDINVRVINNPRRKSVMEMSKDGRQLTINLAYYKGNETTEQKTRQTIAHELQHMVQSMAEKGGGTSLGEARRVAERKRRRTPYKGGRFVLDYRLTDAQVQEIARKTDESEQALSYLNGDESVPSYIKELVNQEVDRIYDSHIGEREARLAETDFTKSPYKSYNEDAKELNIAPLDFESQTTHLRNSDSFINDNSVPQFSIISNAKAKVTQAITTKKPFLPGSIPK